MKDRLVIGFEVEVELSNGKKYWAKVDTGADSSSIDKDIAEKIGYDKIVSHKIIRSALGRHRRPTIMLSIKLEGKEFVEKFSIADRSNLSYKILIGKDILVKEGFLVDPLKK